MVSLDSVWILYKIRNAPMTLEELKSFFAALLEMPRTDLLVVQLGVTAPDRKGGGG